MARQRALETRALESPGSAMRQEDVGVGARDERAPGEAPLCVPFHVPEDGNDLLLVRLADLARIQSNEQTIAALRE